MKYTLFTLSAFAILLLACWAGARLTNSEPVWFVNVLASGGCTILFMRKAVPRGRL